MNCPRCGSKEVVGTNKAKRALAWGGALGAGLLGMLFSRSAAGGIANSARRQICPEATYICLKCKKTFSDANWV